MHEESTGSRIFTKSRERLDDLLNLMDNTYKPDIDILLSKRNLKGLI